MTAIRLLYNCDSSRENTVQKAAWNASIQHELNPRRHISSTICINSLIFNRIQEACSKLQTLRGPIALLTIPPLPADASVMILRWSAKTLFVTPICKIVSVKHLTERPLSRHWNCWSLRCYWNSACRRCSNCIFIFGLTFGLAFKFWKLVRLIFEVWLVDMRLLVVWFSPTVDYTCKITDLVGDCEGDVTSRCLFATI